MIPDPKRRWTWIPAPLQVPVLILLLWAFYFLPWCPFWIAAFYVDSGWAKLILAGIGVLGPFLQAITLSVFYGSD